MRPARGHVSQNFSGRLLESYILSTDRDVNPRNCGADRRILARRLRRALAGGHRKGFDVSRCAVATSRSFCPRSRLIAICGQKSAVVATSDLADQHPLADVLLISPRGEDGDPTLTARTVSSTTRRNAWRLNKDRVAPAAMKSSGFTDAQQTRRRPCRIGDETERRPTPTIAMSGRSRC